MVLTRAGLRVELMEKPEGDWLGGTQVGLLGEMMALHKVEQMVC